MEPDLSSPESIKAAVFLLLPGIIFAYCRNCFLSGKTPVGGDMLVMYFTLSAIYHLGIFPIVEDYTLDPIGSPPSVNNLIRVLFIPGFLGCLVGIVQQRETVYKFMRNRGLDPAHRVQTAWDWLWGLRVEKYVSVTLKNGRIIHGHCNENSFMSSQSGERDIVIGNMYKKQSNGRFTPTGTSVFIACSEISTIQIFMKKKGTKNEEANANS